MPSQRIEYMLADEVSSLPRGGPPAAMGPPSPDYTRQVPFWPLTYSTGNVTCNVTACWTAAFQRDRASLRCQEALLALLEGPALIVLQH